MHYCIESMLIILSFFLIFSLSNSVLNFPSHGRHLCLSDQRDALLKFKKEFYVQSPDLVIASDSQTATWSNNTDCCSWDGISCDRKTGKIVELDLSFGYLNGPLMFNSSLFRLQHLQRLMLDSNNLTGSLPDSIGNLKYLRVLSFYECNLFGKIPSSVGNLSYLTHLELSNNDLFSELPDSIGDLKYLRVLTLHDCNLFGKIPSSFGNLFYLTDLDLSNNDLSGELPISIGNLSKLKRLDLGSNKLNGNVPPMLLNCSKLSNIYLDSNQFQGTLPSNISSLSQLEYFVISGNSFSGSIPPSLFMIRSLISLDMERNRFNGFIEIGNITSPSKLQDLSLGENNLSGSIPRSISKLVSLTSLDLSFSNSGSSMVDLGIFSHLISLDQLDLSGHNLKIGSTLHLPSCISFLFLSSCNLVELPKFLQTQTSLRTLDVSRNQIEGQVPEWLWRLPKLGYVNISHNSFSGFDGPADVIQRSKVSILDISLNTFLDFPLLPNSMNFFSGSQNRFSGEIPRTICELDVLYGLVLSNNNFNGSIPLCFERLNSTISVLHLRNNSLSGILPEESINDNLISLDVGQNRLSGKLPKSLINCTQLEFLNLEDNIIKDEFPFWLRLLPDLQILVLRSNEFYGPISSPGVSLSFPRLRIFDISENSFTGVLPSDYFVGWHAMSSVEDSSLEFIFSRPNYHKSVDLTSKGLKMELIGSGYTIYKTIDVSGNKLEGNIPKSISFLKQLIVLNMSNNAFRGCIPPSLSNLTNLQSLDLSQNILSGQIPQELGTMTFLARMNFSYNKLEGPIPQSTQIQSQDSSSFAYNPRLCGIPLQETCGKEEAKQEKDEDEEKEEEVLNWTAAAIGYVPGLLCGLAIGSFTPVRKILKLNRYVKL